MNNNPTPPQPEAVALLRRLLDVSENKCWCWSEGIGVCPRYLEKCKTIEAAKDYLAQHDSGGDSTAAPMDVEPEYFAAQPIVESEPSTADALVKHMVTRFLGWRLPKPWSPDNGISYARPNYAHPPADHDWPVGTNLFSAAEAEAMVRHMLEGFSGSAADGQARGDFRISVLANMADEFAGFDLDSYQRKLLNQARAICANPPLPYHAKLSATSGGDWVLVPREPTKEMLKAVANGDPVCGWAVKDIYSAMLAAALSARKAESSAQRRSEPRVMCLKCSTLVPESEADEHCERFHADAPEAAKE